MSDKDSSKSENTPPTPSSSNDRLLRDAIKTAVKSTNTLLASLEEITYETSSSFSSRLLTIGRQGRLVATKAYSAYEQRTEFGPQIVAGSAVLFGGLMALRRGKITGALSGVLGGSLAYGGVYGIEAADGLFPTKTTKDDEKEA
uniref:Uncharacterized protein n=1 Tax=Helicotheca tamesis TaxID=374047 RepID=A0A7S2HE19_9STRA